MTKDYGTIRIPREDFDRHNERRKDLGLTWVEYLDGEAPEPFDVDALISDLRAQLPGAIAEELEGWWR